jgi:hypothetical protein
VLGIIQFHLIQATQVKDKPRIEELKAHVERIMMKRDYFLVQDMQEDSNLLPSINESQYRATWNLEHLTLSVLDQSFQDEEGFSLKRVNITRKQEALIREPFTKPMPVYVPSKESLLNISMQIIRKIYLHTAEKDSKVINPHFEYVLSLLEQTKADKKDIDNFEQTKIKAERYSKNLHDVDEKIRLYIKERNE